MVEGGVDARVQHGESSGEVRPTLIVRLRRRLRGPALRLLITIIGALPVRTATALGRLIGRCTYLLFTRERRLALLHLTIAFPERSTKERARLASRSFAALGATAAELAVYFRRPSLAREVEIAGSMRQVVERGLARGRGMITVTGHIGNWELFFRRMLDEGIDAYAVGKEPDEPYLQAMLERVRGEGRTIWRGAPGASRTLLRAFRKNAVVALLIDQDTRVQGVFVPFFGRLAHTPRAPAELALRTGAAVCVAFIHRKPGGGHVIEGAEVPLPTGRGEAAVRELTATLTACIEAEIRRVPHDWVWMHRRWKTRPSGAEPGQSGEIAGDPEELP